MRILLFPLWLLVLAAVACDDDEGIKLAEPPTAAECEALVDPTACEARGCTYAMAHRAILEDAQCAAVTLHPVCIAAREALNNAIGAFCRDSEDGGFEFVWFGSVRPVDGWEYCGVPHELCGVSNEVCEAQTDRDACEAAYCHWAEPVKLGVLDEDGQCTGWEPQTAGMCLTPEPFLSFLDGVSSFETGGVQDRTYSVDTGSGSRRVLGFAVGSSADFSSSDGSWRQCLPYAEYPNCGCP